MSPWSIFRLAYFEAFRALGTRRWWAVPPVMFLAGALAIEWVEFDFIRDEPRKVNVWDGPLGMINDGPLVVFVIVLGFIFVTGDLYVRDRALGTAGMTLLRCESRNAWWIAKMLALGILSLVYSGVAFGSFLILSAIRLPLSFQASPASELPWGTEGAIYPRFESFPISLFLILIILYTAFALWGTGAVILAASALYPRQITPLSVAFFWIMAAWLIAPIYSRQGLGTLDPMYQVSYVIHFSANDSSSTSWMTSLVVILLTIVLTTAVGAWKLRNSDI